MANMSVIISKSRPCTLSSAIQISKNTFHHRNTTRESKNRKETEWWSILFTHTQHLPDQVKKYHLFQKWENVCKCIPNSIFCLKTKKIYNYISLACHVNSRPNPHVWKINTWTGAAPEVNCSKQQKLLYTIPIILYLYELKNRYTFLKRVSNVSP